MLARPSSLLLLSLAACSGGDGEPTDVPVEFVGTEACAGCHVAETAAWHGSHHDLAMQEATEETVLGDFDDATFTYAGVTSTFFRRDGGFHVRTDGPDGELADYDIAYTFGVDPLQQYLIPFRGGRFQMLGIAWDTRLAAEGGQRWFHLYPGGSVDHEDELHWTRNAQTWNHACAECHTTGLEKGYDLETDRYATTWQEIDVACEACHGPGSWHVVWARSYGGDGEVAADRGDSDPENVRGLLITFRDRRGVQWVPVPSTGIAHRSEPPGRRTEVEACARCHSLRTPIHGDYVWGRPLLATHRPELIRQGVYFPDGQLLDEVYEYGSFRQTRMYRAGVTCSDCHDPHNLELRAEGNAICAACHDPSRFDTSTHHFHPPGAEGSRCVECHMPSRIYMQVDGRRDHSIRIPRPDLSERLGTPNACMSCHTDRSNAWAVAAVERWYGRREEPPGFAEAFAADDRGLPDAAAALVRVASDREAAGIVRASALARLAKWPDAIPPALIEDALADPEPLIRFGAVLAIELTEPSRRLALATPALGDSVEGVRQEAARILAPLPDSLLTAEQRRAFDKAAAEYVDGLMANADRPWALLELAAFRASRGEMEPALGVLRRALEIHPDDPDLLAGMVTAAQATGRPTLALEYAERLQARFPEDPRIRRLVEELRDAVDGL
ncbi:MAG: cytochrome c3 family protein [Gemmatimonadota bacterium]